MDIKRAQSQGCRALCVRSLMPSFRRAACPGNTSSGRGVDLARPGRKSRALPRGASRAVASLRQGSSFGPRHPHGEGPRSGVRLVSAGTWAVFSWGPPIPPCPGAVPRRNFGGRPPRAPAGGSGPGRFGLATGVWVLPLGVRFSKGSKGKGVAGSGGWDPALGGNIHHPARPRARGRARVSPGLVRVLRTLAFGRR